MRPPISISPSSIARQLWPGCGDAEVIDRHVLGAREAVVRFDSVELLHACDARAPERIGDCAAHVREHVGLARARAHFRRVGDRRRAMSPTFDVGKHFEIDAEPLGVLAGARLAREEHDGCAVGDLAAVLLADAAFDRRVGGLVLREAALVECPAARLRVAIAAAVREVDLRDTRQMLLLQAEAAVVFVGDVAEHARPRIARFLILVAAHIAGPPMYCAACSPDTLRICSTPSTAASPYRPASISADSREYREASRGARAFVTRCGQTCERRIARSEQPAEVTLIAEQLRGEVADVRHFDVLRLELRLGQAVHAPCGACTSAISMPLRAQLSAKSV